MTKKTFTPQDFLNDPPPGVELTVVGGQALTYWTLVYQPKYPELFPDEVIGSTFDIDFVVSMREACKACHNHWGGKLLTPEPDDPTPELGILVFNEDDPEPLEVDLLPSLFGLDREHIENNRDPFKKNNPAYDSMYVLSEWAVVLNRIYNTVSHSKYQNEEAFTQVRNAFAIHHSYILWLLDKGRVGEAQSDCSRLLRFAKSSNPGLRVFVKFGLDLLQAIPLDDVRFDATFRKKGLAPLIEKVRSERVRLVSDAARRRKEMGLKA